MFSRFKQFALLGAILAGFLGTAHASVQSSAAARVSQASLEVAQAQAGRAVAEAALAKAHAATVKIQLTQTQDLQKYTASELKRVRLNSERLLKMHPVQAKRVAAVIRDLEQHRDAKGNNYRPLIDALVFRTPAQQAKLKAKGYSTVSFSFHNAYKLDPRTGKVLPDSLAADVVDAAKLWNVERPFWLKLASSAQSHSSTTGITWRLSTKNRRRLALAIATKEWNYRGPLGWDTAHVEPRGISIGQARRGIRPK